MNEPCEFCYKNGQVAGGTNTLTVSLKSFSPSSAFCFCFLLLVVFEFSFKVGYNIGKWNAQWISRAAMFDIPSWRIVAESTCFARVVRFGRIGMMFHPGIAWDNARHVLPSSHSEFWLLPWKRAVGRLDEKVGVEAFLGAGCPDSRRVIRWSAVLLPKKSGYQHFLHVSPTSGRICVLSQSGLISVFFSQYSMKCSVQSEGTFSNTPVISEPASMLALPLRVWNLVVSCQEDDYEWLEAEMRMQWQESAMKNAELIPVMIEMSCYIFLWCF